MTTIQISTRVDDQIKDMAQKVFERQGLDISTALKMFITKTAYEQEVPLSLKNSETTTPYPSDWFNDERISNRKILANSIIIPKKSSILLIFNKHPSNIRIIKILISFIFFSLVFPIFILFLNYFKC